MSPKSIQQLLETVETGTHFLFTVVRHPFDRLISAYRDRILNGCTDQAKHHIPGIFKLTRPHLLNLGNFINIWEKWFHAKKKTNFWLFVTGTSGLYNKDTSCVNVFPAFQEFIQYVNEEFKNPDAHWRSYHQVSDWFVKRNIGFEIEIRSVYIGISGQEH